MPAPVLVSGCLLGLACRYDGGERRNPALLHRLAGHTIIPICPEQLGGLPTPRPRAELRGGDGLDCLEGRARVVDETGQDVTAAFIKGAEMSVEIARIAGARRCILKAKSPSCGLTGRLGVTAARCILAGLEVEEA